MNDILTTASKLSQDNKEAKQAHCKNIENQDILDKILNLDKNIARLIYDINKSMHDYYSFHCQIKIESNDYKKDPVKQQSSLVYACFIILDVNFKVRSYVSHNSESWQYGESYHPGSKISNQFVVDKKNKVSYSKKEQDFAWEVLNSFGYTDKGFKDKVTNHLLTFIDEGVFFENAAASFQTYNALTNTNVIIPDKILENIEITSQKEQIIQEAGILDCNNINNLEVYLDKTTIVNGYELPHPLNNFKKTKVSNSNYDGKVSFDDDSSKGSSPLSYLFWTFLCVLIVFIAGTLSN